MTICIILEEGSCFD